MNGAGPPAGRAGRDLREDAVACRTLAAGRQTEKLHLWRQCAHMQRAQRRLRNTCRLVTEVSELIVDR
jgi:hypothetical protein